MCYIFWFLVCIYFTKIKYICYLPNWKAVLGSCYPKSSLYGPRSTDRWPRFVRSRLRTTFSQYRPTYVWQINYLFSSLFVYIFTFYECFSLFRVVLAYEVRYSKSHDRSSANQNASFHRNASFHPYMGEIIITCYFVIFHF